jgi:DNA-binding FrmR family transcriptional regulator
METQPNKSLSNALEVVWTQIKTLSMLIDNTQNLCDRCFELLKSIEAERTEARAEMIAQHIRDRIAENQKPKKKNGHSKKSGNSKYSMKQVKESQSDRGENPGIRISLV